MKNIDSDWSSRNGNQLQYVSVHISVDAHKLCIVNCFLFLDQICGFVVMLWFVGGDGSCVTIVVVIII